MELKRKLYSAAEVSRTLRIKPHVLRYWETKFEIKPERNSAGRRIYTQAQVEKLAKIKFLRYQEKMTVKGAKSKLIALSRVAQGKPGKDQRKATLLWLKKELISLRDMLSAKREQ